MRKDAETINMFQYGGSFRCRKMFFLHLYLFRERKYKLHEKCIIFIIVSAETDKIY